jgi:hypothetical protein
MQKKLIFNSKMNEQRVIMKTNKAMSSALLQYKIDTEFQGINLSSKLQKLLTGGVCELSGCFFLKKMLPRGFNIDQAIRLSHDRTQVECDINHIHIDDFLDTQVNIEKSILEQGLLFSVSLQQLLVDKNQFITIISFTQGEFPDCNVRFHKKRENENWLVNNINLYEEGIAVID